MSQQDKFAETVFWDKVAKQRVYAAFDNEEYEALISAVWEADMSGLTVADIGSASGVSAALFAARGAKVLGIEIAPELVAQAKELWRDYTERIDFRVGDAEHLDLPDASLDAVFFGGVLHHIPLLDQVYAEAFRLTITEALCWNKCLEKWIRVTSVLAITVHGDSFSPHKG